VRLKTKIFSYALKNAIHISRGQFFKQFFAPTEKLAPTGKVGALAMLG
jgi:hypothetical protein